MQRRSLLRTLAVSGAIGTSIAVGTTKTNLVQPVQAQSYSNWYQQTKLSADDAEEDDLFGRSLSISTDGTTAVIGAEGDDGPNGNNAGSAYVFNRIDDSWSQETKLTADDGDSDDFFGDSLAVSGDGTIAIIGAPQDNLNGNNAGSAYVFSESGGSWSQEAKLSATDGNKNYFFGDSIAISNDGTTAVIGAKGSEDPDSEFTGSAYVFSESGGSWSQEAKLTADDGEGGDLFGFVVAVSGDGTTAIIGTPEDENSNGGFAGSTYVFDKTDQVWGQSAKLIANDGDSLDEFGYSVSLSSDGTTAIIGARNDEDPNGVDAGSAYVFSKSSGSWSQETKLTADDGDNLDLFGDSSAISSDGTTAVVGALQEESPNGDFAGSAYVFNKMSESWNQEAKLSADDGNENDSFGDSIAMSSDGTTVMIGARRDEDPAREFAGSAYVFSSSDTSESVEIVESSLDSQDVESQQSTHTLSIIADNVSADGSGDEFDDEFEVTFPEEVILEGYSNVDIEAQFSDVEQNGNTLNFSVSPSGGGTTQVSVEMDVTLSPVNN